MSRRTRLLSALVALGLLAALGFVLWNDGGEVSGCRVLITTSEADGPVDVPLFLRNVKTRERYPLEVLEGGEPGEQIAPAAPSGYYTVEADSGWGILWVAPQPPYLSVEDRTAREIPMGRGRTLYVGALDREEGVVGETWAVEREGPDGTRTLLDTRTDVVFSEMAAIRFEPEDWHGRVILTGRMGDGSMVRPLSQELGDDPADRPKLVFVRPAPVLPLAVHVVSAGVSDEAVVEIRTQGIAVDDSRRATVASGVAGFAAVPDLERSVRVTVLGEGGWSFELPIESLRRLGSAYVVRGATQPVSLAGAADSVDRVLARLEGSDVYARLRLEVGEDGRRVVHAPRGAQRWLVRAGATWAELPIEVRAETDEATIPAGAPGAVVRGRVDDPRRGRAGPGYRVLFHREEDGGEFTGSEMDVAVLDGGEYEARIPAGRYAVRIQRPRGMLLDAAVIDVGPGVTQRRTLSPAR